MSGLCLQAACVCSPWLFFKSGIQYVFIFGRSATKSPALAVLLACVGDCCQQLLGAIPHQIWPHRQYVGGVYLPIYFLNHRFDCAHFWQRHGAQNHLHGDVACFGLVVCDFSLVCERAMEWFCRHHRVSFHRCTHRLGQFHRLCGGAIARYWRVQPLACI